MARGPNKRDTEGVVEARAALHAEIVRLYASGVAPRAIRRMLGCTRGVVSGAIWRRDHAPPRKQNHRKPGPQRRKAEVTPLPPDPKGPPPDRRAWADLAPWERLYRVQVADASKRLERDERLRRHMERKAPDGLSGRHLRRHP